MVWLQEATRLSRYKTGPVAFRPTVTRGLAEVFSVNKIGNPAVLTTGPVAFRPIVSYGLALKNTIYRTGNPAILIKQDPWLSVP